MEQSDHASSVCSRPVVGAKGMGMSGAVDGGPADHDGHRGIQAANLGHDLANRELGTGNGDPNRNSHDSGSGHRGFGE